MTHIIDYYKLEAYNELEILLTYNVSKYIIEQLYIRNIW